jgi:hypothetical protein
MERGAVAAMEFTNEDVSKETIRFAAASFILLCRKGTQ